ncbi:MAG: tetratricopeptide repeat protein [Clostridia bacterium]|nr:tetratricopeptide repeat protein [Clostridia bacterium]
MNKKKIVRIITVTAAVLLNCAMAFLLVNEYEKTGKIDTVSIIRTAAIFGGTVITIVKIFYNPGVTRSQQFYRERYKQYAENAFLDDKGNAKKFFSALDAYNNNKFEKALKMLKGLLPKADSTTDRFAVLSFMGLVCHDWGMYDRAIEYYDKAISLKPSSELYSNKGICYDKKGNMEMAIESYKEAIAIDPNNATAYSNVSQLAMSDGEFKTALIYATKARELDKNLKPAKTAIAICFFALDMMEDYEEYMKSGILSAEEKRRVVGYLKYMGFIEE